MDWGDVPTWALVVVGAGSMLLVVRQLAKATKALELSTQANRTSNLMAVLALEASLAAARADLSEAAQEVALIAAEEDAQGGESVGLRFANLRYEERKEQYLNAADRLCACIIRGDVPEEEYRQDYRRWIAEIVEQHADRFGADTRHRNIRKVNDAWSEDKSARQ